MKKIVKSILLVLIVLSSTFLAQTAEMDNDSKKIYNEGNKLRKSGDYAGAIAKYDEALKLTSDYRVYYNKSVTLKKLRKYDEAEAALLSCIENKKDFSSAYNALGGIYFANGQYSEAIEQFEKFKQYSDQDKHKEKADQYIAQAYTKLALKEKSDNKYPKAVEYLLKAVDHAKFDKAYLALAEVYIDMQKWDEALEAGDKALNYRKKISKGGPNYFKGMAFKGKGDNVKAKECFLAGKNDKTYGQNCKYELESL
ncbi:MAG: tetratricopeptide repeat protein [Melioribacteraceae bacterium]|nr:tetratricopeptide repeat protein [Melioribacteraceae bacterium]